MPEQRDSLLAAENPHGPDLLVLSHLRWNFVFQRPQHLISRLAQHGRAFFFEEPVFDAGLPCPFLQAERCPSHPVVVLTPHLPWGADGHDAEEAMRAMLTAYLAEQHVEAPVLWYYTPAMLPLTRHLEAAAVVYDCMDELANFRFAAPELPLLERELLKRADAVFTGGYSLYEQKRRLHGNVHPFPSGVDAAHFGRARAGLPEPADQAAVARPRLGFYGVIDERIDFALLRELADAHREWSIVMVGPLAKVGEEEIVRRPNIHYLGPKAYAELPAYLSGWEVGLMPFAINEATRFISPTKTPEYLAGGVPVVSTAITDVARHYGGLTAVSVTNATADFIAACGRALTLKQASAEWLPAVDRILARLSWDEIARRMDALVAKVIEEKTQAAGTIAAA